MNGRDASSVSWSQVFLFPIPSVAKKTVAGNPKERRTRGRKSEVIQISVINGYDYGSSRRQSIFSQVRQEFIERDDAESEASQPRQLGTKTPVWARGIEYPFRKATRMHGTAVWAWLT